MPIGGKDAFLSKVIFRRESNWCSKTRQMLKDMETIEERAWGKYPEVIKHHNLAQIDINEEKRKMYIEIATEQKAIDDANLEKIVSSWKEEEEYWIKRNKELIDKAWKWLEENQAHIVSETGVWLMWTAFEKDFRKTMEE